MEIIRENGAPTTDQQRMAIGAVAGSSELVRPGGHALVAEPPPGPRSAGVRQHSFAPQ